MNTTVDLNELDLGTLRNFVGYSTDTVAQSIERLLIGVATDADRGDLATWAARQASQQYYPRTCEALARVLEQK